MKFLTAFIERIASYRLIILLVILFGLFAGYILPQLEQDINEKAGKTVGIIDLLSGLNPSKVYEMIEDYGHEGRKTYLFAEVTADIVYPIIYTLLFSVILFVFYEKLGVKLPIKRVFLLPFLIMLFDYTENLFIITMLVSYPTKIPLLAYLCSVATAFKWATLYISFLLIVYGGIMLAYKRLIAR